MDELHATLRCSFVSAFESSASTESQSFAKHVREFLDGIQGVNAPVQSPESIESSLKSVFKASGASGRALCDIDPAKACEDEAFVRQLEAAAVEWCAVMSAAKTRNESESVITEECAGANEGPLVEIRLWRARHNDLSGLVTQLADPSMDTVLDVLERFAAKHTASVDEFSSRVRNVASAFKTLLGEITQRERRQHQVFVHARESFQSVE
jgi:dynein heavy chain